jgi:hypothetical protein
LKSFSHILIEKNNSVPNAPTRDEYETDNDDLLHQKPIFKSSKVVQDLLDYPTDLKNNVMFVIITFCSIDLQQVQI